MLNSMVKIWSIGERNPSQEEKEREATYFENLRTTECGTEQWAHNGEMFTK